MSEIKTNTGWNKNIQTPYVLVHDSGLTLSGGHECQCQQEDCEEIISDSADSAVTLCPGCYQAGHMPSAVVRMGLYLVRHGARATG